MARKRTQKEEQPVAPAPEPVIEEPKLEEPVQEEAAPEPVQEEQPVAPAPEPIPAVLATKAPMGSKAKAMRDKLASQPKVRVFIPLAAGEKQGVTQSVILNGYPMYIRKGQYVDVPQAVAEVLETKLKHKMMVENHPERMTADNPVKLTSYGN